MKYIWTCLCVCASLTLIEASLRFTNLKCEVYRPDYVTIQKCYLKVVRRDVISMNINAKLLQGPVTNASINLSLHKKFNGFRPFLYNYTVNFCQFMANRKRYPFIKIFYDNLLKTSNVNHTCPYDGEVIVDNLILKEEMFKYIPLELGEYMIQLKIAANNDWKVQVQSFLSIDKDF